MHKIITGFSGLGLDTLDLPFLNIIFILDLPLPPHKFKLVGPSKNRK